MIRIFSKWSFYQLIAIVYITSVFFIVEQFQHSPPPPVLTMGFIIAIVSWVYAMLYLQLKKKPNFLEHPIWKKMPFILFGIGLLAVITFILLVTIGPLGNLVAENRSLLYVSMLLFISLFFLFIMSMVHKVSESKHNVLNHTLLWTCAVLIITLFML